MSSLSLGLTGELSWCQPCDCRWGRSWKPGTQGQEASVRQQAAVLREPRAALACGNELTAQPFRVCQLAVTTVPTGLVSRHDTFPTGWWCGCNRHWHPGFFKLVHTKQLFCVTSSSFLVSYENRNSLTCVSYVSKPARSCYMIVKAPSQHPPVSISMSEYLSPLPHLCSKLNTGITSESPCL